MSILSNSRDLVASIALCKAMEAVRNRQLQAVRDGKPLSTQEIEALEKEANAGIITEFYSAERSRLIGLDPGSTARRAQYMNRSTAMADLATLENHRLISRLPVVGDAQYQLAGVP